MVRRHFFALDLNKSIDRVSDSYHTRASLKTFPNTLNRNIYYKLYGQKIRVTESENDLGVIINIDMKFKDQVASAAKKADKL